MTLNCDGELLSLDRPRILGILNVTPDSFFDGGQFDSPDAALRRAEELLEAGADFIDIGGYSSRPGAEDVPEAEEIRRTVPVIAAIRKRFPDARISIDTFRSRVASEALEAGASLVNDITGATADPHMLPLVAERGVPVILMHMRGNPATMSVLTDYHNLVPEILQYFSERIAAARALGIVDVIADPGFGFAKTRQQNFELLAGLETFRILEVPVLVGLSRKSMIWKTLGIEPQHALNGTTALHMAALERGACLLRVHDVREARECISLWEALGGHG